MSQIRSLKKDDVPQIADLHYRVFHESGKPDEVRFPPELLSAYVKYFDHIFFQNPWYDEAMPSLVYESRDGKITGFLGVMPRRMTVWGRPITIAISSQLVVDPGSRAKLAGIDLLRAFLAGPQDLSMADGANEVSRRIWEKLGGSTALLHSITWTRLLRPGNYFFLKASGVINGLSSIKFAANPLMRLIDSSLARRFPRRFKLEEPRGYTEELTEETLFEYFFNPIESEPLRPSYDKLSLKWLLEVLAQKKKYGEFKKVAIRNDRGALEGWYIYYSNPGGVSEVMQIEAREGTIRQVLNHLFYHARQEGAVAVTGRMIPKHMGEFAEKRCIFDCGYPWMLLHSNKPELLQGVLVGDALLTRMEGEWVLHFDSSYDAFTPSEKVGLSSVLQV